MPNDNCPICGGEGDTLGVLGGLTYNRCRQCGMDFTVEGEPEGYDENEEFDEELIDPDNSGGWREWGE